MRSLALAALVLLAGCDLYFSGGDDTPCAYAEPAIAENLLRNPHTGMCESIGYPCDGRCGPCPAYETADLLAQPDWGSCYSQCEALDEISCTVTAGCRAAYINDPLDDGGLQFWGCWATAPSGPIQGGGCAGLDAQECSRHDDCAAQYEGSRARRTEAPASMFTACVAENVGPACTGPQDCGPDQRCTAGAEECNSNPSCTPGGACTDECWGHCVPSSSCGLVDCAGGYHCEETCIACDPATDFNCPVTPSCEATCVPDVTGCAAADCGPGSTCVETCTPGTPGSCTITCVPDTQCEALQTEAACTSRTDCTPVYLGDDCTCYPGYCECNVLTYNRCQTR